MSFISDPSGSIYTAKATGGGVPTGKFFADDANQIRSALFNLADQFRSGTELPLTSSAITLRSSGLSGTIFVSPSPLNQLTVFPPNNEILGGAALSVSGAFGETRVTCDNDTLVTGLEVFERQASGHIGVVLVGLSGTQASLRVGDGGSPNRNSFLDLNSFISASQSFPSLGVRAGLTETGLSADMSTIASSRMLRVHSLASGTQFTGSVAISGALTSSAVVVKSGPLSGTINVGPGSQLVVYPPNNQNPNGANLAVSGAFAETRMTCDGDSFNAGLEVYERKGGHGQLGVGLLGLSGTNAFLWVQDGGMSDRFSRLDLNGFNSATQSTTRLYVRSGLDENGSVTNLSIIASDKTLRIHSLASGTQFTGSVGLQTMSFADASGSTVIRQGVDQVTGPYYGLMIIPSSTLGFGQRVMVSGSQALVSLTTDADNNNTGVEVKSINGVPGGITAIGTTGTAAQLLAIESSPQGQSYLNLVSSTSSGLFPQLLVKAGVDTQGAFFDGTSIFSSRRLQISGAMGIEITGSVSVSGAMTASSAYANIGDVEVSSSARGLILRAPNGGRWRLTVDNTGTLITTAI